MSIAQQRGAQDVPRAATPAPAPEAPPSAATGRDSTAIPEPRTRLRTTPPSHYTGPDRRSPTAQARYAAQLVRIVVAVVIITALWSAAAVWITRHSATGTPLIISLTHSVTGAVLLASAALALALWRITGTTRAACAVAALALAGLSAPVLGILSRSTNAGNVRGDLVEILAGATELALIACAVGALVLPPVTTRLRPLRIATPTLAVCVLAVVAIVTIDGDGSRSGFITSSAYVLRLVNVALWVAVGAAYLAVAAREKRPADPHQEQVLGTDQKPASRTSRRRAVTIAIGLAALLPAAGSVAQLAVGPVAYQTNLVATGYVFALACLVAGIAANALWRLHTANGNRLLTVTGELYGVRTDLADLESDQARRLHDARNAIFAIAGATELLAQTRSTAGLEPQRLQRLITAELGRLGHLLDRDFRPPADLFAAKALLEPLLAAYRAGGMTISADIADAQIYGRRESVANAVTNILTNARVHAPGAHVWVAARPDNDHNGNDVFRVEISDNGPGIPEPERAAVLLPGVRGHAASADGSGLGLASAAQALSEAGGTLRLSERKGGGTMVTITIPVRQQSGPVAP